MSAGRKIVVALRAVGIWGTLGLIGWLAGALPPIGAPGAPEASGASGASGASEDEGATANDTAPSTDVAEAVPVEPTEIEPGGPTEPAPSEHGDPPVEARAEEVELPDPNAIPADEAVPFRGRTVGASWSVLLAARPNALTGEEAAMTAASIVGDARPELLIALGAEAHVVGVHDGRPLRIARIGDGAISARPARPLVADVTGDGLPDLVVGHARLDPQGAPTGGTLQLFPGNATGGLDPARTLAPIATVALAAMPDARGARVVAMHWADGFGRRPSELWIFNGGASPARRGRARIGSDGADVAALPRETGFELATVDASGLTHLSAEGARLGTVELPEGSRVIVHDLDGDGAPEIIALGRGLHVIRVGDGLAATPIDAPHGIRRLLVHDVDGDGRPDILGVTRGGVACLRQREPMSFVEEPLVSLPGGLRAHDAAIIDGDRPMLVIVGLSVAGWQLIGAPLGPPVSVSEAAAEPLPDAPIVLTLPSR